MTVRPNLWRTGTHTFAFSIATVAVTMLMTVALSRLLGPAGKGGYDLVVATVALFGVVVGFSMPAGVIYAVARGLAAPRSLAPALITIGAAQGAVAALVTAALRMTPLGRAFVPDTFGPFVPVAVGLMVAASLWAGFGRAILLGRQDVMEANRRDLAARALAVLVVVAAALALAGNGSADSGELVVWAALVGSVVGLAPYILALVRTLGSPGPRGLRSVIGFATPAALANILQFLNYRLDLFLVGFFLGPTEVGLYALAGLFAQLIWLLSTAASTVMLPRVASVRGDHIESAHETALVARAVFAATIVMVLGVAVTASWLVPIVFGAAFAPAVPAILYLLPGIAIFAPVIVIGSYMGGTGRPDLNLVGSTISFAVTLVLDLVLIPAYGIVGAAIASSVSYATAAAVMFFLFRRISGIGPTRVLVITLEDGRLIAGLLRRG